MTAARIPTNNYVAHYDPTKAHHRAWLQAALDRLTSLEPGALQEGSELRDLWKAAVETKAPTAENTFDKLMPLLDLIARGEGNCNSINRGRAGDTSAGYPGLDKLTIAEVQSLQRNGFFAVGRYQFIPETLSIAIRDAGMKPTDLFSHEGQDMLAVALLLGGKRPQLRDYLQGSNEVSIEAAMLDLAKEWASLPMANGKGFYDGDKAGNQASAKVLEVQQALKQARAALAGKPAPRLHVAAQQKLKLPPHLVLTKSGKVDPRGLHLLKLQEVVNGIPMAHLLVISGAPGKQTFRKGRDSLAGSLEPLPEGRYSVGKIEWKEGRDSYAGSFGEGLGPVWVAVGYQAPGKTARSALGIHLDENQSRVPGTAGCIGLRSMADLKRLVTMLRAHDPRTLYVDWGLGTCPPVRPI